MQNSPLAHIVTSVALLAVEVYNALKVEPDVTTVCFLLLAPPFS